jgi:1,4-alpha-glucan branching enzyme
MVLSTDAEEFGGFNQIPSDFVYPMQPQPWDDRDQSIQVYLPSRAAIVLAPA